MQFFRNRHDLPGRGRRYPHQGELPMQAFGNPSFTITRVVPTCQQVLPEGQQWPERTDLACLWCEHTFDWAPVGAPISHNAKKDVYHLKWNFCSFNCCKAWMMAKNLKSVSNIFWMATRLYGSKSEYRKRIEGIRPAPQKEALRKYGGWMSIEEFRGSDILVRPANAHAISVRWEPVTLAVDVDGDDQLANQSRVGLAAGNPPAVTPSPSPRPLPPRPAAPARPNSLDAFLKGGAKRSAPSVLKARGGKKNLS